MIERRQNHASFRKILQTYFTLYPLMCVFMIIFIIYLEGHGMSYFRSGVYFLLSRHYIIFVMYLRHCWLSNVIYSLFLWGVRFCMYVFTYTRSNLFSYSKYHSMLNISGAAATSCDWWKGAHRQTGIREVAGRERESGCKIDGICCDGEKKQLINRTAEQ